MITECKTNWTEYFISKRVKKLYTVWTDVLCFDKLDISGAFQLSQSTINFNSVDLQSLCSLTTLFMTLAFYISLIHSYEYFIVFTQ